MVVAMVAMGMVQPAIHKVIDVIPVGHAFVSAGWAMRVRTARLGSTLHGISGINFDDVLVNMILMHMMKMTIMEIIDVVLMAYCCMSTIRTVSVIMVRVLFLATSGHRIFPFFLDCFVLAVTHPPQTTVQGCRM
jgi:hypothetical protein